MTLTFLHLGSSLLYCWSYSSPIGGCLMVTRVIWIVEGDKEIENSGNKIRRIKKGPG